MKNFSKATHRVLAIFLAVLLIFPTTVAFARRYAPTAEAPQITVKIDGTAVIFPDQAPINYNGRTLVPLRSVFEELGFNVSWQRAERRAVLTRGGDEIIVYADSSTFFANGEAFALDAPVRIIGGRMMLPIRPVLESVGYFVRGERGENAVLISRTPFDRAPAPDAISAIADFSWEFLRQTILSSTDDENMIISPLSAYFALAMVALGAGGQTLEEFAWVLGRDPFVLAPELGSFAAHLMDTDGSTELTVAGSVWIDDIFSINPAFDRLMTEYFGAPAFPRDFSAQETLDEINAWISEKTNGLIPNALEEIPDDIMMYLINTLYFYAKWAAAFRPMNESVRQFSPEAGAGVSADFLTAGGQSGVRLDVRVTDTYEAVLLPYDDGRLGFFMARPTDGTSVRDFALAADISEIFSRLAPQNGVVVHMPELDKDFSFSLIEILQTMGLVSAFSPADSDLDALVESLLGYPGLYISSVEQIVRIMVDSEGTEAAAVTIIGVSPASIPPPPQIILDFNTPYIYAILDLQTGIPLFIGIVDNV